MIFADISPCKSPRNASAMLIQESKFISGSPDTDGCFLLPGIVGFSAEDQVRKQAPAELTCQKLAQTLAPLITTKMIKRTRLALVETPHFVEMLKCENDK